MNSFYINDDQLLLWAKQGFLVAPKETLKEFVERVTHWKSKENNNFSDSKHLSLLKEKFDVNPSWMPIDYSSKGLRLWEAGYVQVQGNQMIMRLHPRFKKSNSLFKLYAKGEVIAHEFCHVARMGYPNSQFEEMFAYELSSPLRKFVGPLFEGDLSILTLAILSAVSIAGDLLGLPYWMTKTPLILFLGNFSIKSLRLRRVLKKAKATLEKVLTDPKKASAYLFRLTDEEIFFFAKGDKKKIKAFVDSQAELRWKVIKLAYPMK